MAKRIQSTSGTCGNNLIFNIESSILTISGTGDMYSYTLENMAPWSDSMSNIGSIIIESGVTSIGDLAFYSLTIVEYIEIPNTVTKIGNYAFYGIDLISTINIPSSVISIGSGAFDDCEMLSSITLPEGITTITESMFYDCQQLTEVIFKGQITSIEPWAFFNCKNLRMFEIPEGVTYISECTFYQCERLQSIELHKGITAIHVRAFYLCLSLTSVIIRGNIDSIGELAFGNCTNLKDCYYYGTKSPSYTNLVFRYSQVNQVRTTAGYTSETFCEIQVVRDIITESPTNALPSSTQTFTHSKSFSPSYIFTASDKYTKSNVFSPSKVFTFSNDLPTSNIFSSSQTFSISYTFTLSNSFTQSSPFTLSNSFTDSGFFTSTPPQTPELQRETKSVYLSLTEILVKSVSFSLSFNAEHSSYQFFPYIIEFLSPSYVPSYVSLIISAKKGISSEQLIGSVCGSVAVLFGVLGIIIIALRKKQMQIIEFNDDDYTFSSDESIEDAENVTYINSYVKDDVKGEIDNWV